MGKPGERIVVYASTRNQYDNMEAAAKSLLLNNVVDKVYFLTEDEEYPNYLPSCIETINVAALDDYYFYKDGPNMNTVWTYMTLYRLVLYDILPQYDRALYLDTDTIVADDISELFSIDIDGYYYAAVVDSNLCYQITPALIENEEYKYYRLLPRTELIFNEYYNAGVLLCNLKALRDGTGKEMILMANTEKCTFNDQDIINAVCRNKILDLPSLYNSSAKVTNRAKKPKIFHLSKTVEPRLINLTETYKTMDWAWIERQMAINKKKEEEAKK